MAVSSVKTINWLEEVEKRKEYLITDTQQLLRINSVLDPDSVGEFAPFGAGICHALEFMLNDATASGFTIKNVDGYAGHIEYGKGEELIGILGHVDVVPASREGWDSDPFAAEIRDGKIFARGALDDKGPMMAAYYGLKIVKELGLALNKRVRIILGTDEESNWRCVERYFATEEMPTIGFSPDADFPIIHAEKGLCDIELQYSRTETEIDSVHKLISFEAGERFNMVPDLATAIIEATDGEQMVTDFEHFCKQRKLHGQAEVVGNQLTLILHGIPAHGSMPHLGMNAGVQLANFVAKYSSHPLLQFIKEFLVENEDGSKFNIACSDEVTKDLTINYGILKFSESGNATIAMNLRYPVVFDFEAGWQKICEKAEKAGFTLSIVNHMKPHHVPADSNLVAILQKVYTEQTGEEATVHSIGGATYARALSQGVAFGPLFPGREDVVHQKNEYMYIDDLVKATAIYAQAIYELAR